MIKETKEKKDRELALEETEKRRKVEQTDILSNYLKNRNFISSDPIELCESAKKSISFGLSLLPIKIDNTEDQKEIDKIRTDASEVLKKGVEEFQITYVYADHGSDRPKIYRLASTTGKMCHEAEAQHGVEFLEAIERSFVRQQHSRYLTKLQKVENDIGLSLVKYDIVQKMTRGQLIDRLVTKEVEKEYGGQ